MILNPKLCAWRHPVSKDLTIGCSKVAPWYPKNLLCFHIGPFSSYICKKQLFQCVLTRTLMPLIFYINMIRMLFLGSFSLSSGITQTVHLPLSISIKFLNLLRVCQLSSEARHTTSLAGSTQVPCYGDTWQLFIRLGDSSKLFFMSAGHPNTLANGIFRKSLQRPRQYANLTQQLCELGHMDLHRGKFSIAKYFTLKPQSAISQICKQV